MSEQSISDKSQIIRNETQQHANTRGRVADVIDDINATKANKTDVTDVEGDISAHLGDFNNPHQVTKTQVGLGNSDNTADIDKPISNAVQAELDDIRTDIEGQTDWNVAQDGRLDQLEQHNIEQDTALGNKANTDASNISEVNAELWRKKLNVPEKQDEVISKGTVTADSSTVYLALHPSGKNEVLIAGQSYFRTEAQSFPFTPVTTGEKILIIEAKPDAQVFHLVQGAESTEAVEPAYSGLFVARILVNSSGQIVEEEGIDYKERAEDAWRNITIAENGVFTLNMGNSLAASFSVNVLPGVTTPTIGLIKQKYGRSFWDGSEFWIHNISNKDIVLYPTDYTDDLISKHITFTETTIVKAESWAKLKIKYGELVVIEMGGSASFPETGSNADVLVKDSAVDGGVKWSNRLTTAETAITTEKNRNDTQDGQITDLNIHQITITTTTNITTNTVGSVTGKGQHGRNVKISNGVNAINLTCETSSNADFVASYTKLGSANITFVEGAGVILNKIDGTAVLNGAIGSTACLTRSGNTFYLQISNR